MAHAEPSTLPTSSSPPHDPHTWISWTDFPAKVLLAVMTAPYRRSFCMYTWRPLREMRDSGDDTAALVDLVREWKTDKYAELNSVQVAASFCAGATLASISWNKIPSAHWSTTALWFSALICSIWAIVASIQTRSILDDLPSTDALTHRLPAGELCRIRCVVLRYKKRPGVAHWLMVFVWQFPSMMMAWAWCTFLMGLTVYVCTPFVRRQAWGDGHKIAIVYLSFGAIGFLTYLFSSVFVIASDQACTTTNHSARCDVEESASSPKTERSEREQDMDGNVEGEGVGPRAPRLMIPLGGYRGRGRREGWMLI